MRPILPTLAALLSTVHSLRASANCDSEGTAKLLASDAGKGHWFGYSVAVDDDTVVVAAIQGANARHLSGDFSFVQPELGG